MLTESGLDPSPCAAYILGATQLCTLPTTLGAGDAVNHTRCCAGQRGADGVAVPSVVAGVAGAVHRVRAHDTVRSFATFLETHFSKSALR